MRDFRNLLYLLFIPLFAGCNATNTSDSDSNEYPKSLTGSWEIESFIDPQADSVREMQTYSSNEVKQKHINATHIIWLRYERENGQLIEMGGGSYEYQGSTYVENVEFFYPPSSGSVGQKNLFQANFKDGKWYHSGYAKVSEFDPETAETAVTDSLRIEEIWKLIPFTGKASPEMIATWELVSFRESPQGPDVNYPEFVNYIKLLTPTHFCWVQSSEDGDVSGTGAGTYQIEGDKYIENPLMFYSSRQALHGTVINFKRNIDGNRWEHYAESVTRNGEKLDDVYIDEVWAKDGGN